MRHPFDGIIIPDYPQAYLEGAEFFLARTNYESVRDSQPVSTDLAGTRRRFIGKLLGVSAIAVGALGVTEATAQTIGTAGQTSPEKRTETDGILSHDGRLTTQAVGEEGGYVRPGGSGRPTTYAVGEEGGYYPPLPKSGPYRRVTTYALGEEGGSNYRPRYYSYYRRPWWRYYQ